MTANSFYEKCLSKRLQASELAFKPDGSTQQKLLILEQVMRIEQTAKMIGDFGPGRVALKADKVAGSTTACLCFVRSEDGSDFYVPNSALKDDTRVVVDDPKQVKAIYKKGVDEPFYKNLVYSAKKVDLTAFRIHHDVAAKLQILTTTAIEDAE